MSGRVPSGQALPAAPPEPCGLRPSGNDPSRECTCHPDDRPEGPCRKRFAASECQASFRKEGLHKVRTGIRHHLMTGLKFRATGKDQKNDGYAYAEIPDWQLRQWVEIIEAAASGMQLRENSRSEVEAEGLQPDPKGDAQGLNP